MADPKNKYAGLPGIASADEKDVYETDDLPEADQDDILDEPESENIERPHLNARSAHERFRGKGLIANKKLDFSDAARRHPNVGYLATSGDWEIAAEGEPETIQQRRNRLQAEFKVLIDDLNKLKSAESNSDDREYVALVPELESSLHQLSQLSIPNAAAESKSTPKQHIQKIEKLIKELNDSEVKKAGNVKSGDSLVTYQLNMLPAHAQFAKSSRLADLELRLKQLETVLGATPNHLNRLQMSELKSVCEGLSELSARVNLLDLSTIDVIDGKLGSLVSKMDSIVDKRGGAQQVEFETKVNELYESYMNVEVLTKSLLPIADRLEALSTLHQNAGQFKKELSQLETEILKIKSKMAADEQAAEELKISMKEVVETVSASIKSLNDRLVAIQK